MRVIRDTHLRCWSTSMLQHARSQKMIGQVFDDRLDGRQRQRSARKLLRDGSALTWLLLFEYMHDQITSHDIPLAQSPLRDLTGALRVKALKLIDEPSKHHGEDHLSAMRWLQHCITQEDLDLVCVQLDAYKNHPDIFDELCVVAASIVGKFAADGHIDAADKLLHVLLFAPTPTTQPELAIHELARHARSLADFHDPLLHASRVCEVRARGAALYALCEVWPERFLDSLDAFEDEARQTWHPHDEFLQNIMRLRASSMQRRQRAPQIAAELHDMIDAITSGEPPHGDLLEQVSNASRHEPEVIIHNALPHLLDCAPETQDLVLDYVPSIQAAIGSGRLLSHLYAHAESIYLKQRILRCCARISARQRQQPTCDVKPHRDFQRRVEFLWIDLLGDAQRFPLLTSAHLDSLRLALLAEPYFCVKIIAWLEDAPKEFGEPALTLLAEAARHDKVLTHLGGEHHDTRRAELAASLQALHDRSTHPPLIISLRKLLNAVRKTK